MERKSLNEVGVGGAISTTYKENQIEIDFRVKGHPLGIDDSEQFSEKTVLDFVVRSYASSCLTLLKRMENYKDAETYHDMNECALRYFPALFCFRHYLELKLKYLYMCYTNQTFNIASHNLMDLHSELKEVGFNHNVFDKPIQYIKDREYYMNVSDGDASVFRYLIKRDFQCKEKLIIPMSEFTTIKDFILDIEHYTEIMLFNRMVGKN